MKQYRLICLAVAALAAGKATAQGVGINNAGAPAHASAMLDISAIDKGLLVPRLTASQRDGITAPATGLLIYQTDDTPGFYYYNGTAWTAMGSGGGTGGGNWGLLADHIYNTNTGNVGIGTDAPAARLHVWGNVALGQYSEAPGTEAVGLADGHAYAERSVAMSNGWTGPDALHATAMSGGQANGNSSVAIGRMAYGASSNASGEGSIAIGGGNASGTDGIAIGGTLTSQSQASGIYSTAIGGGNASFWGAVAIGSAPFTGGASAASGECATAIGGGSATGPGAMAFGSGGFSGTSQASGLGSLAMATGMADGNISVAIGAGGDLGYSIPSHATGTTAVAIGGGEATGSNAIGLGAYGRAYANWSVATNGGVTNGAGSVALAYGTTTETGQTAIAAAGGIAGGVNSVAMGRGVFYSSEATADQATAFGGGLATGQNSIAMGTSDALQSVATGSYATAFSGGTASGNYSTAIGRAMSTNEKTGAMALGDYTSSPIGNDADNQMLMRFGGGYKLYTNYYGMTGVEITPGGTAKYMSDVTGSFEERSLVDKAYVDNAISGGGSGWAASEGEGGHMHNTNIGNVGIGTTSPVARLHVGAGSVLFSGPAAPLGGVPAEPPIGMSGGLMWYADKAAFKAGHYYSGDESSTNYGWYSLASGYSAVASGDGAIALGGIGITRATGSSSVAIGRDNTASAADAMALGTNSLASGEGSVAVGAGANAPGTYALAVGSGFAMGNSSMALGSGYASGQGAIVLSRNLYSTANGDQSMVLGSGFAYGHGAMAIGQHSAYGVDMTSASGDYATAIAGGAAGGERALAIGGGAASGAGAVAIGSPADIGMPFTASFAGGINSFAMAGGNAAADYSLALGRFTSATGENSTAIAKGQAAGYGAIAIGYADAFGSGSMALGTYNTPYNAKADGAHSIAIGTGTEAGFWNASAWGMHAVAIGSAIASGDHSTALGHSINTGDRKGAFAIGDYPPSYEGTTDPFLSISNDADNQMIARFAGGYKLYGNVMDGTMRGLEITPDGAAKYMTDVTASFTDRSLVDKAYVDNAVSGMSGGGSGESSGWTVAGTNIYMTASPGTSAGGGYSFAAGDGAVAAGQVSGALGSNTYAGGDYSTAVGRYSSATGLSSFAGGNGSTASGESSVAFGEGSSAVAPYSVAMGLLSQANGVYSIAMGNNARATDYSIAMGMAARGNGFASSAIGYGVEANGSYASALGSNTHADGTSSLATGENTNAYGSNSTAMGAYTTAGGVGATATGWNTSATGNYSTAMGRLVSTNSMDGAFAIGDASTSDLSTSNDAANQMMMRFAGGYKLYSDADATVGAQLAPGSNAWSTISDRRKKENFSPVNGEAFLKKIAGFKLTSWNYKGQDPKMYRHYGPMAQDFYAAFGHDNMGTVGNDTTINQADMEGVSFVAIQALEKRTAELLKENAELRAKMAAQEQKMSTQDAHILLQQKENMELKAELSGRIEAIEAELRAAKMTKK